MSPPAHLCRVVTLPFAREHEGVELAALDVVHPVGPLTAEVDHEDGGDDAVAGELIIVDCGPAATHKLVKAGLWPTDVDYLFFTHHHFDHDVDFPCFLLCRWDQSIGKENQLQVFGPTLTEKITEGIIGENGVFAHDWKALINHPASQQVF